MRARALAPTARLWHGRHYGQQIEPLRRSGRCPELLRMLTACCADEVHHKDDAAARADSAAPRPIGRVQRLVEWSWGLVVRCGSAVAAEAARRL